MVQKLESPKHNDLLNELDTSTKFVDMDEIIRALDFATKKELIEHKKPDNLRSYPAYKLTDKGIAFIKETDNANKQLRKINELEIEKT